MSEYGNIKFVPAKEIISLIIDMGQERIKQAETDLQRCKEYYSAHKIAGYVNNASEKMTVSVAIQVGDSGQFVLPIPGDPITKEDVEKIILLK